MKELFDTINAFTVTLGGLQFKPADMALRLVLPVIGAYVLYRVLFFFLKRFLKRTLKLRAETAAKASRVIRWTLRILVWCGWIVNIAWYFGAEIPSFLGALWGGLTTPVINSGATQISIITIILVIPVIALSWWGTGRLMRLVDSRLLSRTSLDPALRFSVFSLARYIVLIVALLLGLTVIGINLSSVAVLLGVLGIGVGFGLQSVVANFIAGLVIVFERPVKVGDRIVVNNLEGDVVRVRLRSTLITTLTNETIIVPNSQLIDHHIHNYSFDSAEIVIVNSVSVAYGTDLELVRRVLLEAAAANPFLFSGGENKARVTSFGDSGITVELRTWIRDAHNKLDAMAWTNLAIWKAFRDNGIVIPFPQVDLHVKPEPGAKK
ncbi:MAG: mechanosensitive ion channel [Spirochaetales bacterium]|nr:mechanosensitive ion channel [Spirochaetales bacterium]